MRWAGLIVGVTILILIVGCGSKGTEVSGEGENKPEQPNPPRLNEENISPNTPLPYQTFTGYVDAGCSVEVRGGAETVTVNSNPDGSFCVVVQLKNDEVNHLEFYAIAPQGEKSRPTTVDITQDPSLEPDAKNVALHKTAYAASVSTTYCPDCTPDKAVDGDPLTLWENSVNKLNPDSGALISPQWWMVNLGGEYYIKTITLKWDGSAYATKFEIWYSLIDGPVKPHEEPGLTPGQDFVYWEPIYSTSYNDDLEVTIDGEYLLTRWIALVLYESSNLDSISHLYKYRLAELEAFGFPPGGNVPRDIGCE